MIEAADSALIQARHKAITAFFLYAAQQKQNGQHEMLDTFLHTTRASRKKGFMWHHIRQPLTTLLNEEGPVYRSRLPYLHYPTYHGGTPQLMDTSSNCGQRQPGQFHIQKMLANVWLTHYC